MNKKIRYFSLFVFLVSLFTACDLWEPDSERNSGHDGKAAVRVQIGTDGVEGRTVRPATALQDATAWELRGNKSGAEETLLAEFTSAAGTVVNIDPGTWNFRLTGYKDETPILSGAITGQTVSLATNAVTFAVTPVADGTGAVNIVIELPAASGVTEARVFWDEEELDPPLEPEDGNIVFAGEYDAGAYYFSVRLYKGEELYGVVSEAVYVWANLTSAKTYTLEKEDVKAVYDEGVYIGLISFAGNATNIPSEVPILLDAAGRARLIDKLTSNYIIASQSGTALFYSVHQALANLKKRESRWPEALYSVNVVTFTDGLDNASIGRSMQAPIEDQGFDTEDEYATYLSEEIASRTIADKPITAYSIGLMGTDVTNTAKFQADLAKIASAGKSEVLTDFGNLQTTFQSIADSLEITQTTSTTFTMKTTMLGNNTKVRMTFDVNGVGSSAAAASKKYIEGTISATGSGTNLAYTFGSITYGGGLDSDAGAGPISGVINGTEVSFVFNNVTGYTPADNSRAKQWLMRSNETAWQINSEYSVAGAADSTTEARSAIIYLVLDASTSLNATQIGQIRDAASTFINSLYLQLIGFVPAGVSATATSSSSISVSWNAVDNASRYYVYRSTSEDGTYSQIGSYITGTSYIDSGLSAGREYYYKVSAYGSFGEGAPSWYASATTKVGAPSSVSATAKGSDSITVSWGPVSGASSYTVYRSSTSGGTYTSVGSATTTSYTDTEVSPNTTYYYKVAAYDSSYDEYGAQSSYASATTLLPAPSGVTATAASSSEITVSWNAVDNASQYYVFRSTSADGTYSEIGSYTYDTSYTDSGRPANTTYYYKVVAYNGSYGGYGVRSSYVSATTLVSAPSGVKATAAGSDSITVSWSAVDGASGYTVYRSTDASTYTEVEEVEDSSATSYTDTELSPNTTYYYKVSASNDNGEGAQSSQASATTTSG